MRLNHHARSAAAVVAVVCASSLVATSTSAVAAKDPSKESRKFRKAVTPGGIGLHLDKLQQIADANDGTRASGTPGYAASRDYVVKKLRAAGYKPTVQTFQFPFFEENAPAQLQRVQPSAKNYANPADFVTMSFSGSGDTTAAAVPVDTDLAPTDASTSGCEPADFAGFTSGSIALLQRGSCDFGAKAANAEAAGASAVVIFNRGTAGNTESINGTLGRAVGIPVVGTSYAVGRELGVAGTTARVFTDTTNETRTTYNVVADTRKGNPDRVVMAGAHLDSVEEGPGINDNGSGSATVLEMAEQMAKVKKLRNTVRFAWWGAEELGLLGAEHYVDDLATNNPDALDEVGAYLNFDMVGSPNYVRFVYDGDNSLGATLPVPAPAGSADIEQLFAKYFTSQRLESKETPFDGRSDYRPFIENGVPSGGLFTGAEGLKTAAEARTYGGLAGVAYDACYHQACDDRDNISVKALDEMSDAAAHVTYVLAQNRGLMQAKATSKKSSALKAGKPAGKDKVMAGHRPLR